MTNFKALGRLEKVDLREAWLSEASDFTPWLAREENLALLGETIGLELELEAQEKEVGPFRADILCKDTLTDNWVLIENQLEKTDHCHLGQLMTYAAGLHAVTIVWIAKRFTDEHRAALDWLNERTDEKVNLFGLEVELWRIGDSPVAPKFNIICQPNNWSRTIQQAATGTGIISEHKQTQLKFWNSFKEYVESNSKFLRCPKPQPQHYMGHGINCPGTFLSSVVSHWNAETGLRGPEIRAEVCLTGMKAKNIFVELEKQKESIQKALGFTMTWRNPEDKMMCRIYTKKETDFTDESLWPEQFEWLRERQETLYRVFKPILQTLSQAPGISI